MTILAMMAIGSDLAFMLYGAIAKGQKGKKGKRAKGQKGQKGKRAKRAKGQKGSVQEVQCAGRAEFQCVQNFLRRTTQFIHAFYLNFRWMLLIYSKNDIVWLSSEEYILWKSTLHFSHIKS